MKLNYLNLFAITLICLFSVSAFSMNESGLIDGYELRKIEGRNVYVDKKALADHPSETSRALDILKTQLQQIDKLNMSAKAKKLIGSVPFFIDWNRRPEKAAEYHPSKEWLVENGWIPEKAKSVNITNIKNFNAWTTQDQPFMILHELAHAFHDQIAGYQNTDIKNAFENALKLKIYERVQRSGGAFDRAYAATDPQEYFAEVTEAYFGKNDFYPFNRKELKTHDPAGYKVALKLWQDNVSDSSGSSDASDRTSGSSDKSPELFDENKFYRLTNEYLGKNKSLDVTNDESNAVFLGDSGRYSGQSWKIEKLGNGFYRLTTEFKGKNMSLDVVNDDQDNKLFLAKTGNQSGQFWKIEKQANGYFRLTNAFRGEGKSLDVVNDGTNSRVQLAPTGNYSGQHWLIIEID